MRRGARDWALKERKTDSGGAVFGTLIHQARKSGQLNLSNRGLEKVPDEVLRMYEPPQSKSEQAAAASFAVGREERWWDQVDLTKLILASNCIREIPEDLAKFGALQVLDLHDNQLVSLPSTIGKLKELRRLNISHNQLAELPGTVLSLVNLLQLRLEHNKLTRLENYLQHFEHLEELDVSHNQLRSTEESLGYMSKLKKLNLSHNSLSNLPSTVSNLRCLQDLDLSSNGLTEVPSMSGLDKLERLDLQQNKLNTLPVISGCSRLKEVYLGGNELEMLSGDWLKDAASVVLLDIRENGITVIPVEITLLVGLERLDVSNNDISSLPYEMGNMSSLKNIVLNGNPLRALRRDVVQKGTQAVLKHLKSRIADLDSSTKEIGALSATSVALETQFSKRVNLSNQKLTQIAQETVDALLQASVETLDLSKNQLSSLSPWISQLQGTLSDLNAAHNKLAVVCPEIRCCVKLTRIVLSNNCLVDLPDMQPLLCLLELVISNNRFRHIPETVYCLVGLEVLVASDNQICDINVNGLQQLPKLTALDLQNNDIQQVPPELGLLTLRSLQISGNPFRIPRPALLAKGTQSVLQYLKDRIPTQ